MLEKFIQWLIDIFPKLPPIPQLPSTEMIQELFPYVTAFAVALFLMGMVVRVFMGKRSALNHAASSAIAVLFVYIASAAIYSFRITALQRFLVPLPMITFSGDSLMLFPIRGTTLQLLSLQVLPLLILCFLVNLLDDLIPQGTNITSWFLFRFLTIGFSLLAHVISTWAIKTYLPDFIIRYAPMVLLGVLIFLLSLGILKFLMGMVLTVIHPVLGSIYAFFFSNMIGKEISKAVLSTVFICLLFFTLDYMGFAQIDISQSNFLNYVPTIVLTMVLWYLLGHTL